MATQVSPKPVGKHDAFIAGQLARAEQRIRLVDLAAGLAGLVAGTLLFAVAVVLLDRAVALAAGTRQVLLLFYLLAAAAYLYLAVVRPLRWRINPLYAARQIEQTLPGQRNHLVNWIDLRDANLPGAIRTSLGQRTARDLSRVDLDAAISNRRAWAATAGAGLMALAVVALVLLFGPGLFGSLLARAFAPFGNTTIRPRTEIALVRPDPADVVVTIGAPVTVVARIDGRVPGARDRDAPCLLYRHDPAEPYRRRYLQYDEAGRDWVATVSPLDVGNGFTYKVTAGDAETVEHRVTTRAAPLIADFLATYRYRPYVGRADRSKAARKLEDLRGTEVLILARTNRVVKDGRLDFDAAGGGGDMVRAELRADDPRALRFRFVLDRPGKYRLRFTSAEGDAEGYLDPTGHDVVVVPDQPPAARITQPDRDVEAPADGHLEVRGEATDDVGLAALTLRLRIVDGPPLRDVPYLADRLGKDLGTPRQLDFRDLIELPGLRDEQGKPFEARPGMTIEYWLEARDACDFPKPNVAESTPRRRIRVTPPARDARQQQKRDSARRAREEHEKKQQDDLKKEKAAREKQREQDAADEREKERQRQDEAAGKEPTDPEKKQEEKPAEKGAGRDRDEQTQKTADDVRKELQRREEGRSKKDASAGEGKGPGDDKKEESKPGEGKGAGRDRPGAGRDKGNQESRDASAPGSEKDAGKGGGDQASPDASAPGGAKDAGKGGGDQASSDGSAPGGEKGAGKEPGPSKPDQRPGAGKADRSPSRPGDDKGPGQGVEGKSAGEARPEGDRPTPDKSPKGEAKNSSAARDPKKGDSCACEGKDGAGKGQSGGKGSARPGAGQPGGARGGAGKPTPGGAAGSGKGGPPEKGAAPGQARGAGATGGGPNGPKPPEDATREDAKAAADGLGSGDEATRQAAAQDLREVADRAKDEGARQAARDALERARQAFEKAPTGQGKPPDAPPTPAKPEEATGEDVERLQKVAGGGDAPGRSWARGQLAEVANRAKDEKARQGARQALDEAWRRWLDAPDKRPRQREKPGKHRPSALQLEEFRKKVDPDVLKEMKMSKEQFEQFLRDYADLAKRQPARPDDEDKRPGVGRAPGTLPGSSGPTIRPGTGADNVRGTGRAKPPPEYRDPYDDFRNRLNLPR